MEETLKAKLQHIIEVLKKNEDALGPAINSPKYRTTYAAKQKEAAELVNRYFTDTVVHYEVNIFVKDEVVSAINKVVDEYSSAYTEAYHARDMAKIVAIAQAAEQAARTEVKKLMEKYPECIIDTRERKEKDGTRQT